MRLSRHRITAWTIGTGIAAGSLLLASVSTVCARLDAAPVIIVADQAAIRDPLQSAVEARRRRVEEAIAHAPANGWSAEYYEGDGLGANIRIALDANAGIAATWRGCLGIYAANEGDVDASRPDEFAFRFRHPNREPGGPAFSSFPERVHAVRWGERRYLIAEDRGIEFVNAMHHAMEPRSEVHGLFLLAFGDESKPVAGLPGLPPALLALVRAKPLTLRVRSVETPVSSGREFPTCRYRIHLDVPPGEMLPLGAELHPLRDSGLSTSAYVTEVRPGTGIAEIKEYDACGEVKAPPKPGLSLTTGAYPSPDR